MTISTVSFAAGPTKTLSSQPLPAPPKRVRPQFQGEGKDRWSLSKVNGNAVFYSIATAVFTGFAIKYLGIDGDFWNNIPGKTILNSIGAGGSGWAAFKEIFC